MAYKDEYEVARLHADPRFREALAEQFEGDFRMSYYLAPPLLSRTDPGTGRPRKIRFGNWAGSMFSVLRRFKGLRGTALDPFGYTAERREERALIGEYRALVREVAGRLTSVNLAAAIELVGAVMDVRGYGPVKHASLLAYRARLPELRAGFETAAAEQREPVIA
jgi:indolepyruvate ferredoxin oxidoreductase